MYFQAIPSLFLSAKNALITATFLIYTAGKCVYLIYLSWRTSLESKRTGICLHKCGVVADDNSLYEIVTCIINSLFTNPEQSNFLHNFITDQSFIFKITKPFSGFYSLWILLFGYGNIIRGKIHTIQKSVLFYSEFGIEEGTN